MLVACQLAGLSALGAHYAGVKWRAMRADSTLLQGIVGNVRRFGPPDSAECRAVMSGKRASVPDGTMLGGP
jgi:hypothetical protein